MKIAVRSNLSVLSKKANFTKRSKIAELRI